MENNNNVNIKGETISLVFVLVLVSTVLIGSSFAWFKVTEESKSNVSIESGSLNLEVNALKDISLTDVVPVDKEDALKEEGFTLTIKNTGTVDSNFDVKLIDKELDSGEERLDPKYVIYNVYKGDTEFKEDFLSNTSNDVIFSDTLKVGESVTYVIRCYLDSDRFDPDATSKAFKKIIRVSASQKID